MFVLKVAQPPWAMLWGAMLPGAPTSESLSIPRTTTIKGPHDIECGDGHPLRSKKSSEQQQTQVRTGTIGTGIPAQHCPQALTSRTSRQYLLLATSFQLPADLPAGLPTVLALPPPIGRNERHVHWRCQVCAWRSPGSTISSHMHRAIPWTLPHCCCWVHHEVMDEG